MQVHSFPPIVGRRCDRLVLGSMPGKASLRAAQYYAHPRNLFWPFMEELHGIDAGASYERRCAALRGRGIALWDVLQTCTRSSSLDSDIVPSSMVPNDFAAFLAAHPRIRMIAFNGAKAAEVFERRVLPGLPKGDELLLCRLPSTSPANASIPRPRKLAAWKRFIEAREGSGLAR